jgi:hypothetical protein
MAAEVVIGDVPAIGQVNREQIHEGCAKEVGGRIFAERAANLLGCDADARAGFGAMVLEQRGQCFALFHALRPGDQSRVVMRRGQGAALC